MKLVLLENYLEVNDRTHLACVLNSCPSFAVYFLNVFNLKSNNKAEKEETKNKQNRAFYYHGNVSWKFIM